MPRVKMRGMTKQLLLPTLEVGDYVWLKEDEPWRFTVAWCHPDYDGVELFYPPEANQPEGQRLGVTRDDIRKAKRPAGKPHVPYKPFEPPF